MRAFLFIASPSSIGIAIALSVRRTRGVDLSP